ncbi:MAG: hypothetical protein HY234_12170 [Acidobacteria bacterium]|nr:hypothetical protein [Acidobacteriota bacterium]
MKGIIAVAFSLFLLPGVMRAQNAPPPAQAPDTTQERLKALEERIRALEEELRAVKAAQAAAPSAAETPAAAAAQSPAPAPTPAPAAPSYVQLGGAGGSAAKALNPDVSVIGNFWGAVGQNRVRPVPGLEFHEAEVAFQAIVDPYARADFFVSFGESGVELEEGYLTLTSLPGGLTARVGKMRAGFGRVNAMHNDALPWIDRPLVTENMVNGEEGINDAGVSLSRILPGPKGILLEATGQAYRGDSGALFAASRRDDVSVVGRLRGYGDITENTNLEMGFSYARGHNNLGSGFLTNLYGVDATLRWRPLRRAIYHSFLWRSEFVWSRRDQLPMQQRAFGMYSAAEYRLNRRWTLGGRFDRSERATNARQMDTGFSALLTYWPSEFSQIRSQYRFTRYDGKQDANELRFQFLFVLGAHGAHAF